MKDLNLPIVANYLANPPFPNVYTEESIPGSLAESQNESASISSASQSETSPCPSAAQADSTCTATSCSSETPPAPDAAARPPPAASGLPTAPSLGLCSPGQALPLQPHTSPGGPAPAFQPFFFTGTFPCNVQGKEVPCLLVLLHLLGEQGS